MKKMLLIVLTVSSILLIILVSVAIKLNMLEASVEEPEDESSAFVQEIIDSSLKDKKWTDFVETDKITLAFGSETENVRFVKEYLKDNKIAIFYVYGGPFDAKMEGKYIICKGFNKDGNAKIYYDKDDYKTEYTYSFEGLMEFTQKVLTFDM